MISSSPARTFARSQTPVEVSSPPHFSTTATNDHRRQGYRTSQITRDSFSTGFTSAKQVLGTRSSAENVPVGSPSPLKFKPPSSTSSPKFHRPSPYAPAQQPTPKPSADWDEIPLPANTVVRILPSDVRKKKKADTGSLQLKKATARRKDWTPTKPTSSAFEQSGSGFGLNLAETFGHSQGSTGVERIANAGDGALTKRRKIDLTSAGMDAPMLKPKSAAKANKPRSKSPAKKGLTITGLATSHYLGDDKKEEGTLMTQWMASTQARMEADARSDTFEIKVKKKAPAKKKAKSRLKSPETALKTLESQEVVFATLSQCARDESPTLIRDTAEAMKQSMEQLLSSPVRTQQTAIYSIESATPQKAGISRFRSRKSLWTAADRDENDALLHMDDPFETPHVRDAFAGKDALFENAASIPNVDGPGDSLDLLATLQPEEADNLHAEQTTFDIDDVTTPPVVASISISAAQSRSYSTSARSPSPTKRTKEPEQPSDTPHDLPKTSASPTKKKPPAKPNYASWSDEQLKEKVKAYGFKRIRARKTMIDKLDEVWAEQNGVDPAKVKAATKAASQTKKVLQGGDILGTVHALAARATPKAKKPRATKSKEATEDKPKRKKKAKAGETQEDENTPAEETVDISDLDGPTPFDRLAQINAVHPDALQPFEPSTAPVKGTGVKASTKKKQRPLTPPPTIPPKPTQDSSPAFASPRRRKKDVVAATPSCSEIADDEVPLKSLIRKALEHPPADNVSRNHQTNPTWHEKILMYDPIVFEDFTAWLNTEGFNAIGEDREIDIMEVKDWCHENGICCLWRGGWRGNKKKAKGEE